ncbi:hypothetical protein MMC13_004678 [Lambiella insularis]|nr:hypothetical protein [Lambiella insularis]
MMIALTVVRDWSPKWGTAAFVLWWINVPVAAVGCFGLPYLFASIQAKGLYTATPATLLPLIAALTAAAGGGVICRYGALTDEEQVSVIIVSYLLVGIGLPLSLAFDAVFISRLLSKDQPKGQETFQLFVLCGPLGQGSFAMLILGEVILRGSFAGYDAGEFITADAAKSMAYSSMLSGLVAWGFGTFWWGFAIVGFIHDTFNRAEERGGWTKQEFTLAAWSVVFPWGVYTNAAVELGTLLDSRAFQVWSTVLTIMLVIIWLLNIVFTIKGIISGKLFGLSRGWRDQPHENGKV